jgi:hypothetical protein
MNLTSRPHRNELTLAQHVFVDAIRQRMAEELHEWLPAVEKNEIAMMRKLDLIDLHSTLGRDIRNEYELHMPEHDVTRIWIAAGPCKAGECDEHPCHPDNFSMSVIERLKELL